MLALLTPLLVLASNASPPDLPLLPSQVSLSAGGAAVGTVSNGAAFEQFSSTQTLEGRLRFGEFILEGGAGASEPIRSALGPNGTFSVRVGWSNTKFAVVGGGLLQWTPSVRPLQLLPALRLQYAPGPVVLTLGVFDFLGQAPAHFSVTYGPIELGYVAPLGGQGTVRIPLGNDFGLRLQVLGNSFFGARQLFFSLTGVYGRQGGRWW